MHFLSNALPVQGIHIGRGPRFFYCRLNWLQPIRPSYQSPYDHLPFPSLLVILLCNRQTLPVLGDGRGGGANSNKLYISVLWSFNVFLIHDPSSWPFLFSMVHDAESYAAFYRDSFTRLHPMGLKCYWMNGLDLGNPGVRFC